MTWKTSFTRGKQPSQDTWSTQVSRRNDDLSWRLLWKLSDLKNKFYTWQTAIPGHLINTSFKEEWWFELTIVMETKWPEKQVLHVANSHPRTLDQHKFQGGMMIWVDGCYGNSRRKWFELTWKTSFTRGKQPSQDTWSTQVSRRNDDLSWRLLWKLSDLKNKFYTWQTAIPGHLINTSFKEEWWFELTIVMETKWPEKQVLHVANSHPRTLDQHKFQGGMMIWVDDCYGN